MEALLTIALWNAAGALLLAVVALAVGRVCQRPALLHALWLLVLLKLVTPPLWPVPVPVPAREVLPPPVVALRSDPVLMMPEHKVSEWDTQLPTAEIPIFPPQTDVQVASPVLMPTPPALDAESEPAPAGQWQMPWLPAALAIWAAGAAMFWALTAVRIVRFRRLMRRLGPAPLELQERASRVADRFGLQEAPLVCLVAAPISPMAWALGSTARLLVPNGLWEGLSEEQRDLLLAHELAHIARRDHWVRLLELIIVGLYWWCPVAWFARQRLTEAAELCCDAWVMAAFPESGRDYAATLVESAAFLSRFTSPVPVGASGLGPVPLLRRRITMILNSRIPRKLSWIGLGLLVAVATVVLPLWPTEAETPSVENREATAVATSEGEAKQVELQELNLVAPNVTINQKNNTAVVKGAGVMSIPSNISFGGNNPAKAGTRLTVRWSREMLFDGRNAEFNGDGNGSDVTARQDDTILQCQMLTATLDHKISLKEGEIVDQKAKVEKLLAHKKVCVLDSTKDDKGRPQIQRLLCHELQVDNQENLINAYGPGSAAALQYESLAEAEAHDTPKQAEAPQLTLTRVNFQERMFSTQLNSTTRKSIFIGNVFVLHVAANSLDAQVEPDKLPKDGILLSCDRLAIFEQKQADGKKTQTLVAESKVFCRGNEMSAKSESVTFDKSQDTMTFKGSTNNPAVVYRRVGGPGGQRQLTKGLTIIYNRKNNTVTGDGVTSISGEPAPQDRLQPPLPAAKAPEPAVFLETRIDSVEHEFGFVQRGELLTHQVKLTNISEHDKVSIESIRTSAGWLTWAVDKRLLEPGESTSVTFKFSTKSFVGQKTAFATVLIRQGTSLNGVGVRLSADSRENAAKRTWEFQGDGPFSPVPTKEDLLAYLTNVSKAISGIESNDVAMNCYVGDSSGMPLSGKLRAQGPRNFRMTAEALANQEIDLGSNNQEFWYWFRRTLPNAQVFCSYQAVKEGRVKQMAFPFQTDWILEALGMGNYGPTEKYDLAVEEEQLKLIEKTKSPQGAPVKKIIVFARKRAHPPQPQVTDFLVVDQATNKPLWSAHIARRQIIASRAELPEELELYWPEQKLKLVLRLNTVKLNAQIPAEVFERREVKNVPLLDLADGDLQAAVRPAVGAKSREQPIEPPAPGAQPNSDSDQQTILKKAKWSKWGTLRKTAIEKDGRPMYRLEDKEGATLGYAQAAPGLSLDSYVGRMITVWGTTAHHDDDSLLGITYTIATSISLQEVR